MAEAAQAAPPAEVAQPAPIVASMDGLDAAMAAARQSAAAQQTALETSSTSTDQAAPEPPPSKDGQAAAPATPAQPASEDDALEGTDEEGETPPADQTQTALSKPSRMGRLREQLTAADQRARDAEARLNERLGADMKVRTKYAALLGTPEEKSQLESTLANASAPDFEVKQARTRLAQMRQAQEELSPLYTAVEQDVFAGFVRGLDGLRTLDGMDDAAHQSLYKATSGVEALKLMHGIGKKAAEDEFKGEIASLQAQVSDLKTKVAARGPQPANGGGLAPGTSSALAALLGADGLPTEEAIARAKAGGLRHLGQPAAA